MILGLVLVEPSLNEGSFNMFFIIKNGQYLKRNDSMFSDVNYKFVEDKSKATKFNSLIFAENYIKIYNIKGKVEKIKLKLI